jgi:hypothetical protein
MKLRFKGSLVSGVQRSMRFGSDLKVRNGVEGKEEEGGDEETIVRSIKDDRPERRVTFWDGLVGDSCILRFELGFIGDSTSDLGNFLDVFHGVNWALDEDLEASSNGANSGDNAILDDGVEMFIGIERRELSNDEMGGMRDAGGLTRR